MFKPSESSPRPWVLFCENSEYSMRWKPVKSSAVTPFSWSSTRESIEASRSLNSSAIGSIDS
ncbi:hypothetical protein D3C78_1979670 [compost metagenome]